MGNLGVDTAVEPIGGDLYAARLSRDWDLWGPAGGYLASIALRAAGAHSEMPRPVSLCCHYLSVARFEPVEIRVTTLVATRRAKSLRVSMTQNGKAVLEAIVWASAAQLAGPERSWIQSPVVRSPLEYAVMAEVGGPKWNAAPFYRNLVIRPVVLEGEKHEPGGDPLVRSWSLLQPQATFQDDLWLDACRYLVHIDTIQFAAVAKGFSRLTFVAPSLDLYVSFHGPALEDEFLLVEARGSAADSGLIGGHARIWSSRGNLVATGAQQMLCRPFSHDRDASQSSDVGGTIG